jgi:hypothetical protein
LPRHGGLVGRNGDRSGQQRQRQNPPHGLSPWKFELMRYMTLYFFWR